jgi:hypothetical protein
LVDEHDMSDVPPVLAFQSSVDATVSVPALIQYLMAKLRIGGGELVIFDINRTTTISDLLREDPKTTLNALLDRADLPFTLSVITNRNAETEEVENRCRVPGTATRTSTPLGLKWPKGIFSLAHISLPFPARDPIYGDGSGPPSPGVQLGAIALRGERGVLRVTPNDMLRQRWNPFYSYLEQRVLEFTGLAGQ